MLWALITQPQIILLPIRPWALDSKTSLVMQSEDLLQNRAAIIVGNSLQLGGQPDRQNKSYQRLRIIERIGRILTTMHRLSDERFE